MVIDQLQRLGFTQNEALAYVALLKENPLNGYELAKRSGIPRPNIYPVLQKLEERGAVLRMDTPEGARFTPLAPADLISRLGYQFRGALEAASSALEEVAAPACAEYALNLSGYPTLLEHARRLVEAAREHLLLLTWPAEAQALGGALRKARESGVRIVTVCPKACSHRCPNCQGDLFRLPLLPPAESRWLILIQDGGEMLAGEIGPQGESLAVRTRQKMLVDLASGYIQSATILARILGEIGGQLEGLLSPQALAELKTFQTPDGWFDSFRRRIQLRGNPN